jgi:hypothetical protein
MHRHQCSTLTHAELVSILRCRYFVSAQASLCGDEEFHPPPGSGDMERVDFELIDGIENRLPNTRTLLEWRKFLCEQLTAGKPIPELDASLDAYISASRPKDHNRTRVRD